MRRGGTSSRGGSQVPEREAGEGQAGNDTKGCGENELEEGTFGEAPEVSLETCQHNMESHLLAEAW